MSSYFHITQSKGFGIKFANGYRVSVQFGPGNYCDNYDMDIGRDEVEAGKEGSYTAECAVINPSGNLIDLPGLDDQVTSRSTSEQVLKLMVWASMLGDDDE